MKLIIQTKPRADGSREVKWTANLLGTGQIASNDEELLSQINSVYKTELEFLLKREPTGEELLKFVSENVPNAKIVNDDGSPVTNKEKIVKKIIRHGSDEKGMFSEVIETKEF